MRRLSVFFMGVFLSLGGFFVQDRAISAKADAVIPSKEVYIGGMAAGFTLSMGGVQVLGFCDVVTESGKRSPAADAGIRAGDMITSLNGVKAETIAELNEILAKNGENPLKCKIIRGEENQEIVVRPVKDKANGRYKIGVLIRDGVSGIGTVTYIEKDSGRFGALGHPVAGADAKNMQLSDGQVYGCSIVGVSKGVRGKAGELRGMFLAEKSLGKADKLCTCGIYGKIRDGYETKDLKVVQASDKQVKPGKASIFTTISGETPKEYEIEIVKVDKGNKENKHYVVKITDDALIEETGGIVQGMSGSPILQNGTLVGAITHVFVNDPTRGYGISVGRMMNE